MNFFLLVSLQFSDEIEPSELANITIELALIMKISVSQITGLQIINNTMISFNVIDDPGVQNNPQLNVNNLIESIRNNPNIIIGHHINNFTEQVKIIANEVEGASEIHSASPQKSNSLILYLGIAMGFIILVGVVLVILFVIKKRTKPNVLVLLPEIDQNSTYEIFGNPNTYALFSENPNSSVVIDPNESDLPGNLFNFCNFSKLDKGTPKVLDKENEI